MKPIHQFLIDLGATSPMTAVETVKVVKAVNSEPIPKDQWGKPVGKSRLVYTELIRSDKVQRIDMETNYATDANGWYAK